VIIAKRLHENTVFYKYRIVVIKLHLHELIRILMELFPLCFDKSILIYILPSKTTILLYSTTQATRFGVYDHLQARMSHFTWF